MPGEPSDTFTKKEAKKRMEAAIRGVRIAVHKPTDSLTRGKVKKQSCQRNSE
jgi:hypothetical protein